ncbi:hypothetical protein [Sphingomicrobium arenosum]|uniref:hypothetical protein n=1 Tax=Sphingomicrobium arenosum TaxID=2233861 RepID=UPI002240F794|nr:hypothetical protein [Sphingomicrobium arenosum]
MTQNARALIFGALIILAAMAAKQLGLSDKASFVIIMGLMAASIITLRRGCTRCEKAV